MQRLIAEQNLTRASPTTIVTAAHDAVARRLAAVYSVNELTPVSRVVQRRAGSCSQRFAVVEAIARSFDVPTRVRGLLVDGAYWRDRFRYLGWLIPPQVVVAWPEFLIDGAWLDLSAVFGVGESRCLGRFVNAGPVTLFDAARTHRLEWGSSASGEDGDEAVQGDLGYFTDRDTLFASVGRTLRPRVAVLADLALRHRAAV